MGEVMGRRRVERVMGTIASLDVRGHAVDEPDETVVSHVFDVLHDADTRFSLFQPDSELARLVRGELEADAASDPLREVLALADDLRRTSGGYFDAGAHRADGWLDPSGLVKGWATEEAARILDAAGVRDYCLNVGGDIITRGGPEPGRAWRVGIRHPADRSRLAAVLAVVDAAVATSGAYERGPHIVDPHLGRPATAWAAVTVIGPSLTYADAYATTVFAMGRPGIAWLTAHPGYGVLAVDARDQAIWTGVVEEAMAAARP